MTVDRRILVGLGIVVVLFANASLLWGWMATPPGTRFVGTRTLIPADTPVYYSYLRQVMDGAVTLRDLYTAEAQPVGTFNGLWFLVGWFGRLFYLTPPVAFHVSRVLLGGVLVWVMWRAARWFLPDVRERLVAWLLMFSGGIGIWLVPFLPAAEYLRQGAGYRVPIDLWLPWAYPILSLGQSPHLVASWALLVGTVLLLSMATDNPSSSSPYRKGRLGGVTGNPFSLANLVAAPRLPPAVWAGIAAAALINFHPYHWPTLLGIPAVWLGLRWVRDRQPPFAAARYLVPLVIGVGMSLAYHLWLVGVSPVVAMRSFQNISRLPPWPYVVFGLGLVTPLALVSLWRRKFGARGAWLVAWVVTTTALVAWPSQFQARYLQGLLAPLALLAAPPLVQAGDWVWQRWRSAGVVFFVAAVAAVLYATPLALVLRDLTYYRQYRPAFYFPDEFFAATEFLRQRAASNEVILASHDSGLFLPAYAGRTLYFGHGDETVGSAAKRSVAELFYASPDPRTRRLILERTGARYVWYGEPEQRLGGLPPDDVPTLTRVYANPVVVIYQVRPE